MGMLAKPLILRVRLYKQKAFIPFSNRRCTITRSYIRYKITFNIPIFKSIHAIIYVLELYRLVCVHGQKVTYPHS